MCIASVPKKNCKIGKNCIQAMNTPPFAMAMKYCGSRMQAQSPDPYKINAPRAAPTFADEFVICEPSKTGKIKLSENTNVQSMPRHLVISGGGSSMPYIGASIVCGDS